MKTMTLTLIAALSMISISASAQRNPTDLIDRLLRCEDEKRNIDNQYRTEIENLRYQLAQCQNNNNRETLWSCTAGCSGLGNVGFGTGRSEAEARKAALQDLGFTCSQHTFDCHKE